MSGEYRGDFLARLINQHQFQKVAELGVWKGRTFFHLLDHCPSITEYIAVDEWRYCFERKDIPGGQTYEKWNMPRLEKTVREGAKKYGDRARIIKAPTVEAAKQIPDASLDLVFVDADHSYKGAKEDILAWRPKIRAGGFLCGHDWSWDSVRQAVDEVVVNYAVSDKTNSDSVWYVQL